MPFAQSRQVWGKGATLARLSGNASNDKVATLDAIIYLFHKLYRYLTKPQAINWLHQPFSPIALQALSSPASSLSKPPKTFIPLPAPRTTTTPSQLLHL